MIDAAHGTVRGPGGPNGEASPSYLPVSADACEPLHHDQSSTEPAAVERGDSEHQLLLSALERSYSSAGVAPRVKDWAQDFRRRCVVATGLVCVCGLVSAVIFICLARFAQQPHMGVPPKGFSYGARRPREQHIYLAAEHVSWTWAPSGLDQCTADAFDAQTGRYVTGEWRRCDTAGHTALPTTYTAPPCTAQPRRHGGAARATSAVGIRASRLERPKRRRSLPHAALHLGGDGPCHTLPCPRVMTRQHDCMLTDRTRPTATVLSPAPAARHHRTLSTGRPRSSLGAPQGALASM